jgi:hypothetical protein
MDTYQIRNGKSGICLKIDMSISQSRLNLSLIGYNLLAHRNDY